MSGKSSSSSVFKSFFESYYSWDNSSHREWVDCVLYEIVKSGKGTRNYKWNVESLDKSELAELVRVLTILQPSLKMKHCMMNAKAWAVLTWSGEFNVPAQYFWEQKCIFPSYPPVVRQPVRGGVKKSSAFKNPWSGRLRTLAPVDYSEQE